MPLASWPTLHFLRLTELGLELQALGNVLLDRDEVRDATRRSGIVGSGTSLGIQTPVFPAIDDLAAPRSSGEDGLPQRSVKSRGLFA